MEKKMSRKNKWILRGGCALVAALVLSWRPCNNALLFHVLPEDALAMSFHHDLASEWHALVRHPMLMEALDAAGVEEAADLVDETGFYQTLYWLTGPKSTLALSLDPHMARPLPEKASSFETMMNDIGLAADSIRVSGASYVGWKRRPMELLWRIRYVPGLGPLNVTESGTRYLVFRHSKTMQRMGLVLSLDMVDGHLLAVLSSDPDAVTSLVARAQSVPDTRVELPKATHTFTLKPKLLELASDLLALNLADSSTPVHLDLGSFKDPGRLALRVSEGADGGGEIHPAPAVPHPADTPILASVALSPSVLPTAEESDPPANGPCTLLLYGNPYPSTFCGFPMPALAAFLPPDSPSLPPRVQKLIDAQYGQDKKRPKLDDLGSGLHLLDLRPMFPKHSIIKPAKEEEPFFIVPADSRENPIAGSCLHSYQALAKGDVDLIPILSANNSRWTGARTAAGVEPLGVGWIDLPRSAAEFRSVEAVFRLASLFLGDSNSTLKNIQKYSSQVFGAAHALGVLDFTLRSDYQLEATFSREP